MKKILFYFFLFTVFYTPNVRAANFECAYDGTNCRPRIATFCQGIGNDVLVAFCTPKNSLNCEGVYDCALVGSPTSTPIPGGPTSTPIPPSPTPAVCSNIGANWVCTQATMIGTMNCNSTDPLACDPNNLPTCTGDHFNNPYDALCGSGWWCCGPSLSVPRNWTYYKFFCNNEIGVFRTALGCLNVANSKIFISQLLNLTLQISAGIGVLIIIFAGFQIATAGGDPKKVQAGKELITAAIMGIILIALSVSLLNFISVQVLNLQNLGFRS